MRSPLLVSLLLVGCTAAPAPIPDKKVPQTDDVPRPFAELEAVLPVVMTLQAPPEMFELREIRLPEPAGACELDTLATDSDAETIIGSSSQSLVETYDHRNCPVYQSATFSDEKGQLTLTVDGMYGEWRRNMWSSAFSNGVNNGYSSGEWINTPTNELENQQQTSQEFDDQGRLIKETMVFDATRTVTVYDYDDQGRMLAIWRDTGNGIKRSETHNYGAFGLELIQYFDANENLTREIRYQYDDKGVLRVTMIRSMFTNTGYPAYTREEYDENGSPVSSSSDQDGDGKADSEWSQEYNEFGLTYRRDRYVSSGSEYITEWSGTYDKEGRLLRGQTTQKNNGRVERLELNVGQRDAEGNWRNVRLTRDGSGMYGTLDVSTNEHFLFSCDLNLVGEKPFCNSITAQLYDKNLNPTQYCSIGPGMNTCQRYVYGANGYVVTELVDENNDGLAERRSEYRYDTNYTEKMVKYLTEARWEQIKKSPPAPMPVRQFDD